MRHAIFITVLLVWVWMLAGCDDATSPPAKRPVVNPAPPPPEVPQDPDSKYLALGDSYTIGQSVDPSVRYPVLLADKLRKQGVDLGSPTIIAQTGWTTRDLLNAIAVRKPTGPFKLVTILIGVNNQFQGRSIDEYRKELVELLNQSIAFAGGDAQRVVAISIPDWGATPFGSRSAGVAAKIDAFNTVLAEECKRLDIALVDVTPTSRTAPEQPDLIAGDGLHPSGKMYALWVESATPAVLKALGQK